ncbi:MAG: hypothetical protein VX252_07520 [Myxococcota bacterium]|nr:hypothetical protein [Myxococcota bacterium]
MKESRLAPADVFSDFGVESDLSQREEDSSSEPMPPFPVEEDPESERPEGRFGFLRGGMTLIWIVVAALYSILRACGEG